MWFRADNSDSHSLIAGSGDPDSSHSRHIEVLNGRPSVRFSAESSLLAPSSLRSGPWHMIAVTDDEKKASLYVDGVLVSSESSVRGDVSPELQLAPDPPSSTMDRFSGEVGGFSVSSGSMSSAEVARMFANPPNFDAQTREENAKPWSIQAKQGIGLRAPQAPDEMPHGAAPEQPRAKPMPPAGPTLHENGDDSWQIAANWRLLSNVGAAAIPAKNGAKVSMPGFDDSAWLYGHSSGHCADDDDRSGHLSRSGFRFKQPGHPRVAQQA